jgi:hypothetical protein
MPKITLTEARELIGAGNFDTKPVNTTRHDLFLTGFVFDLNRFRVLTGQTC